MADSVELRMSVTSIKRVDPYVKEILATSTHVALYQFNSSLNEWERTETEGVLFLYSRNGEPWHSIIIMNRLNNNNLIEPIVNGFEHQMQSPFLLYRNLKNKIFGIWFYNREECMNITYLLETIMEIIKDKKTSKTIQSDNHVDIFSMLSKAQEEFNKTPKKKDGSCDIESAPKFSSTPRAPDLTSQSVVDFFAKASSKNVKTVVHVKNNESDSLLQKLKNNPVHSVEHIEKQQRSVTPQEVLHKNSVRNNPVADKSMLNGVCDTSPIKSVLSPLSGMFQTHNLTNDNIDRIGTSPLLNYEETSPKIQLMPPIMFASTVDKDDLDDRSSSEITSAEQGVDLLTKNQILQAVTYLLKNDPDFIKKLHEAYIHVVNEKLNTNI